MKTQTVLLMAIILVSTTGFGKDNFGSESDYKSCWKKVIQLTNLKGENEIMLSNCMNRIDAHVKKLNIQIIDLKMKTASDKEKAELKIKRESLEKDVKCLEEGLD